MLLITQRKNFAILSLLLAILTCGCKEANVNYTNNPAPLHPNRFIELPLGSIRAEGWLKEMLIRQKNGLTGHLDEYYPEVMGPRNGWLGGDGDQWERGPYWIDGLLPLAYILDDEELIAKTTPWIEWILSSSKENGQFGPDKDYPNEPGLQRNNCQDWWPRMVVLKVLQQYYSATSDSRVIDLMTRYFRYQLSQIRQKPLDNWTFWARYRGAENLMSIYWLYSITSEKFLIELADIIYSQTEPFTEFFLERERLTRVGSIHSVNLAQGIKTPIVYYQYDHKQKYLDAVDCAMDDLRRFHGYPTGMFSGDEAIHGNDPTQGTELCTIVEYMFSLETMYRITGDPKFAETLEKVTFNALPAQTTDDYMARQYFQQVNQIYSVNRPANFDVNHSGLDACFGLLTGYPCCTSNMHQGWPKFTQNLWYATPKGGLAATIYSPSKVKAKVADGVDVEISERTNYPFEENISFHIESMSRPVKFPFTIRIPGWSKETIVAVNGVVVGEKAGKDCLLTLDRIWTEGDVISVEFRPEIELSVWKENARSVERGPLVYALKVESTCREVQTSEEMKFQGDSFLEFLPASPWNYALIETTDKQMEDKYELVRKDTGNEMFPWNEQNAPLSIFTDAVRVKNWTEYNRMAGPLPFSTMFKLPVTKDKERIELIPYGCTTLRITEFPILGHHSAE